MDRKQYTESKTPRTRSWQSQPEFDNEISTMDMSSLRFMKCHYKKEIKDFPNQFDLNHPDYSQEYKKMMQRFKMISEELEHRFMDTTASETYHGGGEYFDSTTGYVIGKRSTVLYSIAYTEDEDKIVCNTTDNVISEDDIETNDETDYSLYQPEAKVEIYEDWKYYEEKQ